MKLKHVLTAMGALAGVCLPTALAQDAPAQPAPAPITWSDEAFGQIAGLLTGSWRTTAPVGAEEPVEVVMTIAPVRLSRLPDTLYVEIARADSLDRPYSRSIFQLYSRQGKTRMRTLEIRDPNSDLQNLVVGMWAAPDLFPDVDPADLIGTLDLELTREGAGWVGRSPYPYPNATRGAVEMTSQMRVTPGRIETADRGYDAAGNVVWGSSENEQYVFEPTEPPYAVERHELGAVIITLRDDTTGDPYGEGDTIAFQYTGWIPDGTMFDTSRRQGKRPLQYQAPGNLIEGWKISTDGMSKGDWRKFVLPPQLGYGGSSAGGGLIPPNSTLIFEAELVYVQPPAENQPQPEPGADQ